MMQAIDQPFKWALLGRPPSTGWARGRVCVLGDAAHPTLPFLAQGANMALEDAAVVGVPSAEWGETPVAFVVAREGQAVTADGKPQILYVGAQYCPYCAGLRWSSIAITK